VGPHQRTAACRVVGPHQDLCLRGDVVSAINLVGDVEIVNALGNRVSLVGHIGTVRDATFVIGARQPHSVHRIGRKARPAAQQFTIDFPIGTRPNGVMKKHSTLAFSQDAGEIGDVRLAVLVHVVEHQSVECSHRRGSEELLGPAAQDGMLVLDAVHLAKDLKERLLTERMSAGDQQDFQVGGAE
jgi:hypothetical protein